MISAFNDFSYRFFDGNKLIIEGAKSIKTFATNILEVAVFGGHLEITGNNFVINSFSSGEICISGAISTVTHKMRGKSNEKLD